MDLRHLYSTLKVELEVFTVQDVLLLRKKRIDQLPAERICGTVVLVTEMEVLRGKHFSCDLH